MMAIDYEVRAEALFREGYNCAQAVFLAFALEKMDREEATKLASALGGGLAGMRTVCGTVSGIAMAYGLLRGYAEPGDKQGKAEVYEAVREMAEEFEKINGSIICRELLGLDKNVKFMPPSDRNSEYYQKRPCPRLCACSAGILARYLENHPEK